MTTKDYLNQISYYNKIIDNKLIEITQYKELSYSISAVVNEERVMSSSDPDKTGCGYVRLEQMEESLDKLIDKYIDVKNKIIEQIEQINNEDYYTVLFLRYVRKFTFEKLQMKQAGAGDKYIEYMLKHYKPLKTNMEVNICKRCHRMSHCRRDIVYL